MSALRTAHRGQNLSEMKSDRTERLGKTTIKDKAPNLSKTPTTDIIEGATRLSSAKSLGSLKLWRMKMDSPTYSSDLRRETNSDNIKLALAQPKNTMQ